MVNCDNNILKVQYDCILVDYTLYKRAYDKSFLIE